SGSTPRVAASQTGGESHPIPLRRAAGQDPELTSSRSVGQSRHVVALVTTSDFDKWLRRLKDRHGKLRILERIDRRRVAIGEGQRP
ncbi:MAG: hypothetical protein ACRCSN_07965, partial [Dermatophilaceae bacterium]